MNTQEERDLTRSLQNQADQFHGAAITFDGVTSRSRSITRRRRIVAGAGVLAAAAILVPAATFMTGQTPTNPDVPPASEVPSKTPSNAVPAEVQELTVDVAAGDPPRVDYLVGSTLHRPDGSTLQLPERQYWAFATLGDGIYTVNYDEAADQQSRVTEFDAAGSVVATSPGVEALAVSPDGSAVAWVGGNGVVEVHTEQGVRTLGSVPVGSFAESVLGSCVGDEPCSVFFEPPAQGKPRVIASDGTITRLDDAMSISDVSADAWVAAMTSVTNDSSCHRVAPNDRDRGFRDLRLQHPHLLAERAAAGRGSDQLWRWHGSLGTGDPRPCRHLGRGVGVDRH